MNDDKTFKPRLPRNKYYIRPLGPWSSEVIRKRYPEEKPISEKPGTFADLYPISFADWQKLLREGAEACEANIPSINFEIWVKDREESLPCLIITCDNKTRVAEKKLPSEMKPFGPPTLTLVKNEREVRQKEPVHEGLKTRIAEREEQERQEQEAKCNAPKKIKMLFSVLTSDRPTKRMLARIFEEFDYGDAVTDLQVEKNSLVEISIPARIALAIKTPEQVARYSGSHFYFSVFREGTRGAFFNWPKSKTEDKADQAKALAEKIQEIMRRKKEKYWINVSFYPAKLVLAEIFKDSKYDEGVRYLHIGDESHSAEVPVPASVVMNVIQTATMSEEAVSFEIFKKGQETPFFVSRPEDNSALDFSAEIYDFQTKERLGSKESDDLFVFELDESEEAVDYASRDFFS